ncbi:MAG: threonine--tRNA ligase [Alphaproteobacteria bacterium]|nr:threonine--tRNA ligase [Alphaproteobacteria bacterium]OJV46319.1 MAG: threonine--tRNA ligase [Alphaproteobacteria bacterium 43-37]
MIRLSLPDGQVREFEQALTGFEFAQHISPSLAKKAVAIRVDGKLKDLTTTITTNASVAVVVREEEDGLDVLRHDAAHVMAEAVKELYPETQITIGPTIEDGFFYDFARDKPFTLDDLAVIEKRMHDIVDRNEAITRMVWSREEAKAFFKEQKEHFKVEVIDAIPGNEEISVYQQGEFIDVCRGPHLPSTQKLGHAFKLMRVSGAYWRGDAKNASLQRIYGTAWSNEADLKAYLFRLEEAEKRDHRRLGREMGLFHLQDEAAGSVFWHPKGWTLYRTLESYIRQKLDVDGYVEVKTPQIVDKSLWEASGHWDKFRQNMFTVETEDKVFAVKPMNCPCHVQIFKQGLKSYRDLPLRMAEFGSCHRNEPSGALHGIMRVRAFTQDDAHIFCSPEQINDETKKFCRLLEGMYKDLGFDQFFIKFSDRPEMRAGDDAIWDQAESALKAGAKAAMLEWKLNPGEGAFYGPKLEFVLKDALGREWQCGTLQVDFVLPERLDASYIGEDGKKHRPVMLHRAVLGSFERFIGILIEHYAGRFPFWLAPVQVTIATITSDADEYAGEIRGLLAAQGIRAELDCRNEKINYKVRELSLAKVPVIAVVGKKEAQERTLALRRLGSQEQEILSVDEAIKVFSQDAKGPFDKKRPIVA